ncbi:MAG: hypothetical protein ABSD99_06375 [Candidatus Bathyarchaeia archaeon]
MQVTDIAVRRGSHECELSGNVRMDSFPKTFRLFFRLPLEVVDYLRASANPFIAALLLPSMRLHENLKVNAPASRKLLATLPRIMAVYHGWNHRFRTVRVDTNGGESLRTDAPRSVGQFFSGGVDSFYTLNANLIQQPNSAERISHLILIHGFDIPLRDAAFFDRVYSMGKDVGNKCDVRVIKVVTNAKQLLKLAVTGQVVKTVTDGRQITKIGAYVKHVTKTTATLKQAYYTRMSDQLLSWDMYFGAILASVGLVLGDIFRRIYIPSSTATTEMGPRGLYPWGSHPDLDPLWSTEQTSFINHGSDRYRLEKVRSIVELDLARQHLRVCWEMRDRAYTGGLSEFKTFPNALTPELVRNINLATPTARRFAISTLNQLQEKRETLLADALAEALQKNH